LPTDVNLARCQRYYYKHNINGTAGPRAQQYHANYRLFDDWFPVTMRTYPTATCTFSTGSPTIFSTGTNRFQAYIAEDYNSTTINIMNTANYSAEL
jgi:DNA polymerase elongation subunit (family B)